MAVKVYVSGICGSQEVRKQQQRVLFILSTLPLDLEIIDITEPGRDEDRNFMQEEIKKHNKSYLLPPQIFNGSEYCGDYDDFQLAADDDVLMRFLKLEDAMAETVKNGHAEDLPIAQNGFELGEKREQEDSNKQIEEESTKQEEDEEKEGEEAIVNTSETLSAPDRAETEPASEGTVATKEDEKPKSKEEEEEESEEEESEEESE